MNDLTVDIEELHWMTDVLQSIDVGLIVMDLNGTVNVWNSYMENHSGKTPSNVIGHNLFDVFPDLPRRWITRKMETVTLLKSRAFSTWEQRPYLFPFKNYRPITGTAEFMYQNVTFVPIVALNGAVSQIGMIIYDVTDIAVNKLALESANESLSNLSRIDRLTQLFNRGYWGECLQREFARYQRTRQATSLVVFNIDHFEKLNNSYGQHAGETVVRETARLLRNAVRVTDICGRCGEAEFGVVLIDTAAPNGHIFSERLRQIVKAHSMKHGALTIDYTLSLGVAQIHPDMASHNQWLAAAESALDQARCEGRDQAAVFKN